MEAKLFQLGHSFSAMDRVSLKVRYDANSPSFQLGHSFSAMDRHWSDALGH